MKDRLPTPAADSGALPSAHADGRPAVHQAGRSRRRVNSWAGRLAGCILLAGLYLVLHRIVQEQQVVAALFAAGPHLPAGTLMLACTFVALRLFVVLILPALLAGYTVRALLDRLFPPEGRNEDHAGT